MADKPLNLNDIQALFDKKSTSINGCFVDIHARLQKVEYGDKIAEELAVEEHVKEKRNVKLQLRP